MLVDTHGSPAEADSKQATVAAWADRHCGGLLRACGTQPAAQLSIIGSLQHDMCALAVNLET
jgi:hypothetical protein